ncbi:hypothetical protein DPMN_013017 [Dreissena polymorpha]|uniref:Uncharacterized protein n=1 Tax=Dreissena polymorpha TaxID=45954 RepID=A0A9D4N942_DREPO|nr:hypothetical protein DPMN_013017 [Dreissena polymorpha]
MATISGNEGDLKTDMDNIRPGDREASDDGPNDGHNAAGTAVEVADTGLEKHGRVPHHEEANTPAEHSLVDQAVVEVKQGQDVDVSFSLQLFMLCRNNKTRNDAAEADAYPHAACLTQGAPGLVMGPCIVEIDRIVIRDVQYQLEVNRCRNEEVNVK